MGRISLGDRVSTWQCMLYNTSPCKRAARTHTTTPALPLPSFSLLVGGWSDYNIDTLSSRGPGFETSIWWSSYDSWLMLVFCESCASLERNVLPPYLSIPAKLSFDRSKNALVSTLPHDWDRAIASPILCKKSIWIPILPCTVATYIGSIHWSANLPLINIPLRVWMHVSYPQWRVLNIDATQWWLIGVYKVTLLRWSANNELITGLFCVVCFGSSRWNVSAANVSVASSYIVWMPVLQHTRGWLDMQYPAHPLDGMSDVIVPPRFL